MNSEVYKTKVVIQDELLASILHTAARIKKQEDQLRRKNAMFAHELQNAPRVPV
jgi:hypothetical protein